MEYIIIVTKLDFEDVSNFLSDALSGCEFFGVDWDEDKLKLEYRKACVEDKCASILMGGDSIKIIDMESDDVYLLNLNMIINALNNPDYQYNTKNIINDCGDYLDSNNILQVALFGKVIFG